VGIDFFLSFLILELVLWNGLQGCHCHQNAFLSIFPLSSGTEKSHWALGPMNREGVPAIICLLAKNSLTDNFLRWAPLGVIFGHKFLVLRSWYLFLCRWKLRSEGFVTLTMQHHLSAKVGTSFVDRRRSLDRYSSLAEYNHWVFFFLFRVSSFSVEVPLLCYAPDSQLMIFTLNLTNFCNVFFSSARFCPSSSLFISDTFPSLRKMCHPLENCCFFFIALSPWTCTNISLNLLPLLPSLTEM
jgi:hypothetical protein